MILYYKQTNERGVFFKNKEQLVSTVMTIGLLHTAQK